MRKTKLASLLTLAALIIGTSQVLSHAGNGAQTAQEPTTFNLLGVTVEMHTMGVLPTAMLCTGVLLAVVSIRKWIARA